MGDNMNRGFKTFLYPMLLILLLICTGCVKDKGTEKEFYDEFFSKSYHCQDIEKRLKELESEYKNEYFSITGRVVSVKIVDTGVHIGKYELPDYQYQVTMMREIREGNKPTGYLLREGLVFRGSYGGSYESIEKTFDTSKFRPKGFANIKAGDNVTIKGRIYGVSIGRPNHKSRTVDYAVVISPSEFTINSKN